MRTAHKLRALSAVERSSDERTAEVRMSQGTVIEVDARGKAIFRDEAGGISHVAVPRHVDRRWLTEAARLAPVPAHVYRLETGEPTLWSVFATTEHEALDEHIRLDGKTITLRASQSIEIRTEKSTIQVKANGEVTVRGRNVTTRASNLNRIRGGAVKIN